MLFGPDNFLTHIKNLVMGGGRDTNNNPANDSGYLVDGPDLLGNSILAASVTYIADSDGFVALNAAASITAIGVFNFTVPRDYDEATDILTIAFVAKMAGATDTPTITVAAKKRVTGGAAAAITPVSGSPTAALSTTATGFELMFRGQGLLRGTMVEFTLTSAAHTTDALQLQKIRCHWHSCLVSYNAEDSSGNTLR